MTTLPAIPHASDVEKAIVGRLVTDLLAAGLSISIWNGGDEPELADSTDAAAIFENLSASDQDELTMRHGGADGAYAGWIRLVWGNDHCVISDYTTRLEPQVKPASDLADDLENGKAIIVGTLVEAPKVVRQPRTTARFWFYVHSGLVRIKMREGQTLSWAEGGPTDDGYSYTGHVWRFENGGVYYSNNTAAVDCDGPISHGFQSFCPLDELGAISAEGCVQAFPHWRETDRWQRDANAEAAGY